MSLAFNWSVLDFYLQSRRYFKPNRVKNTTHETKGDNLHTDTAKIDTGATTIYHNKVFLEALFKDTTLYNTVNNKLTSAGESD